jgi:type I restriction enzyme M protein
MLDTETKNNIDTARQILVGKVPDPKSQIEQITIAIIYKFMDDMDRENQDAGFKKQYFVKDWQKYAWTKLLDKRLSGHKLIDLYVQAISNMPKNPYIPQLFRDIFRDAFLPYKDPRTLSLFIKEINKFTYDNSENLGNAFEYLLSILGSQGDAGQFRTPRHIIDFIVAAVDPQKNEKILDPACGTAGFLISAYKHIVKQKYLTTSENLKLMNNVVGYDISPDMVRLALVNLYLHGFSNPKIYEYDTLTSEKRWDENFDVILANPPFMSPKGGIQPHDKFSVQVNRSEVLFVDYITEHLTLKGRAGIIVPEGIIFQSGNAYKELRKLLVDEFYLYAVVSLPGGVFQPYSGVKTSILFLDRQIAKQKENILFVKIDNDGFDLGAQRRSITANDLPEALKIINDWKADKDVSKNDRVIVANRKQIAENGDYNLSAERYRIIEKQGKQKWDVVKLGDVCEFEYGKPLKEENRIKGEFPVYGSNGIVGYHNEYFIKAPFIIVGRKGSAGSVNYSELNGWAIDTTFFIKQSEKIRIKYLYFILRCSNLDKINTQAGVPGLNRNDAYKVPIPLPPLEVQEQIVAEIETYQKIIDGALQVIENWKPKIKVDEKWKMVKLGDVCDVRDGTHDSPTYQATGFPLVTTKNIIDEKIDFSNVNLISKKDLDSINKRSFVDDGDIIMPMIGTIGKPIVVKKDREFAIKNVALIKFFDNSKIDRYLLKYILDSEKFRDYFSAQSNGGTQKFISLGFIRNLQIPLPPLDIQEQIVAEIEAEQKAIDACKELIKIHENKINETIMEVWSE